MERKIFIRLLGPAQGEVPNYGPALNLPDVLDQSRAASRPDSENNVERILRRCLANAASDIAGVRQFGLEGLLSLMASISGSDAESCNFRATQINPKLQVLPILFERSLMLTPLSRPNLLENTKFANLPPSDKEIELAIAVFGCCCLLHDYSRVIANDKMAVDILLQLLVNRPAKTAYLCLDALLALLVFSSDSRRDFAKCNGVQRVAARACDQRVDLALRQRCVVFLMILATHSPLAGMHGDVTVILGVKAADLIMEVASSLDDEETMHLIAERLLNSL